MSRHAKTGTLDDLTPMQRTVVEELRRGRSWTAAAATAGYSDPSGEVSRLKANAAIIDAVLGPLQERAASWELLGEKARKVLDRNMGEGHDDWCRSLQPPDPEQGWPPCNCWFAKIRASDANTAARISTDVLKHSDPRALAPRSSEEAARMTDEQAALEFLGEATKSEGETAMP